MRGRSGRAKGRMSPAAERTIYENEDRRDSQSEPTGESGQTNRQSRLQVQANFAARRSYAIGEGEERKQERSFRQG